MEHNNRAFKGYMTKSVLQQAFEKEKIPTVEFMDYLPGRDTCLGVEIQHKGITLGQVMAIVAFNPPDINLLKEAKLYDLDIAITGNSNVIGIVYFPGVDYVQ